MLEGLLNREILRGAYIQFLNMLTICPIFQRWAAKTRERDMLNTGSATMFNHLCLPLSLSSTWGCMTGHHDKILSLAAYLNL
jgi:hypothetical protein